MIRIKTLSRPNCDSIKIYLTGDDDDDDDDNEHLVNLSKFRCRKIMMMLIIVLMAVNHIWIIFK